MTTLKGFMAGLIGLVSVSANADTIEVPIYGFNQSGQSLEEALAPNGGIYGAPSFSGTVSGVTTFEGTTFLPPEGTGALLMRVVPEGGDGQVGFYNYSTLVQAGDIVRFHYLVQDVEAGGPFYNVHIVSDIAIVDLDTFKPVFFNLITLIERDTRDGDSSDFEFVSALMPVSGLMLFEFRASETEVGEFPSMVGPLIGFDDFGITRQVTAVPIPAVGWMMVLPFIVLARGRTRTQRPYA